MKHLGKLSIFAAMASSLGLNINGVFRMKGESPVSYTSFASKYRRHLPKEQQEQKIKAAELKRDYRIYRNRELSSRGGVCV